jgi:hypothetical protein
LLNGFRVRLVKNEDRFLTLVPINLNKFKKKDELHIYDTTRFKTLKNISYDAVEGGIVSKFSKYNRYSDTSFCLQVSMSHKDDLVLPGLWDIFLILLSIFSLQG